MDRMLLIVCMPVMFKNIIVYHNITYRVVRDLWIRDLRNGSLAHCHLMFSLDDSPSA